MPFYAQVNIEDEDEKRVLRPGDVVRDDLPGIEHLIEYGSVASERPTRQVEIDSDNRVVAGPGVHPIHRWEGDVTADDIENPDVDTDSNYLGMHFTEADHKAQEPAVYIEITDDADASDSGTGND